MVFVAPMVRVLPLIDTDAAPVASTVSASVLSSAAAVVEPATTLLNAYWLTSAPVAIPFSLVLSEEDIRPDAAVVASA